MSWLHAGALYFTTQRVSLKARRIKTDGRVTVHVGRADGPVFLPPRVRSGAEHHPAGGRAECVLLVDDVITTGATMRAAARELRNGGVNHVIGAAAARRP